MMIDKNPPSYDAGKSTDVKLSEIYDYLYYLTEQINCIISSLQNNS